MTYVFIPILSSNFSCSINLLYRLSFPIFRLTITTLPVTRKRWFSALASYRCSRAIRYFCVQCNSVCFRVEQEGLFGFHRPPFISVGHLHLHVIYPRSHMPLLKRIKYLGRSFLFIHPTNLINSLTRGDDTE